jgi:D-alanine-D-alanine ligase
MRLVLAFGGVSSEHEISIRSATEVLAAIDRERFDPVLLGIPRAGPWRTASSDTALVEIIAHGRPVRDVRELEPDIVFPVLHGPHGEDGTFQGMLELVGVPYVGSGVLGSALCMDKAAQKQLTSTLGIPQLPWIALDRGDRPGTDELGRTVGAKLGFPCFAKPANMGSSIGVSSVRGPDELDAALDLAFRYDTCVVVERGIAAREIEVAILGNGDAGTQVSAPGEIRLPTGEWYDYDTKYEKDVATLAIPAELPTRVAERIREVALAAFRATRCKGLARVDFLVDRNTLDPYLNELNTMPGFTTISMYPKLMEHAGIPYGQLITRLCELGLAHHAERRALRIER